MESQSPEKVLSGTFSRRSERRLDEVHATSRKLGPKSTDTVSKLDEIPTPNRRVSLAPLEEKGNRQIFCGISRKFHQIVNKRLAIDFIDMQKTEINIEACLCSREFALCFEDREDVVQSGVKRIARVAC